MQNGRPGRAAARSCRALACRLGLLAHSSSRFRLSRDAALDYHSSTRRRLWIQRRWLCRRLARFLGWWHHRGDLGEDGEFVIVPLSQVPCLSLSLIETCMLERPLRNPDQDPGLFVAPSDQVAAADALSLFSDRSGGLGESAFRICHSSLGVEDCARRLSAK